MDYRRLKFVMLVLLLTVFFSSCLILDAIKDRYIPYKMVGMAEDGRVLVNFVFDAPSAKSVWLAGSFNNWASGKGSPIYPDVELIQGGRVIMEKDEKTGYWTATIPLKPGRYPYKYVIDEGVVWREDPNTAEHVDDGFGGFNSIVMVTVPKGAKKAEKKVDTKEQPKIEEVDEKIKEEVSEDIEVLEEEVSEEPIEVTEEETDVNVEDVETP